MVIKKKSTLDDSVSKPSVDISSLVASYDDEDDDNGL